MLNRIQLLPQYHLYHTMYDILFDNCGYHRPGLFHKLCHNSFDHLVLNGMANQDFHALLGKNMELEKCMVGKAKLLKQPDNDKNYFITNNYINIKLLYHSKIKFYLYNCIRLLM